MLFLILLLSMAAPILLPTESFCASSSHSLPSFSGKPQAMLDLEIPDLGDKDSPVFPSDFLKEEVHDHGAMRIFFDAITDRSTELKTADQINTYIDLWLEFWAERNIYTASIFVKDILFELWRTAPGLIERNPDSAQKDTRVGIVLALIQGHAFDSTQEKRLRVQLDAENFCIDDSDNFNGFIRTGIAPSRDIQAQDGRPLADTIIALRAFHTAEGWRSVETEEGLSGEPTTTTCLSSSVYSCEEKPVSLKVTGLRQRFNQAFQEGNVIEVGRELYLARLYARGALKTGFFDLQLPCVIADVCCENYAKVVLERDPKKKKLLIRGYCEMNTIISMLATVYEGISSAINTRLKSAVGGCSYFWLSFHLPAVLPKKSFDSVDILVRKFIGACLAQQHNKPLLESIWSELCDAGVLNHLQVHILYIIRYLTFSCYLHDFTTEEDAVSFSLLMKNESFAWLKNKIDDLSSDVGSLSFPQSYYSQENMLKFFYSYIDSENDKEILLPLVCEFFRPEAEICFSVAENFRWVHTPDIL